MILSNQIVLFILLSSSLAQPSLDFDWADLIITSGPKSYVALTSLKSTAQSVPEEVALGAPLAGSTLLSNVDRLQTEVGQFLVQSFTLTRRFENELKQVYQTFYFMSMSCQRGLLASSSIGQVFNMTAIAELKRDPSFWEQVMAPMNSILRSCQTLSQMIILSLNSATSNSPQSAQALRNFNNSLQHFTATFFQPNFELMTRILELVQAAERDATRLRNDNSKSDGADANFCPDLIKRMITVETLYAKVYFFARSRNEVMNHFVISQLTPSEVSGAQIHDFPNPEQTTQGLKSWLDTVAVPGSKAIVDHRLLGFRKWQSDTPENKLSKCFDTFLD